MSHSFARQTQFPVGQGGLHLTQIWDQCDPQNNPFSMIYDCGGYGSKAFFQRQLIRVRRSLRQGPNGAEIDLLVLSHLHHDHINGFVQLVSGPSLTIKRLLIPHYDEENISFLLAKTAFDTGAIGAVTQIAEVLANPAQWFGERGVEQIVEIGVDDREEPGPVVPTNPDGEPPEGFEIVNSPEAESAEQSSLEIWTRHDQPAILEGNHILLGRESILRVKVSDTQQPAWLFLPYARQSLSGKSGHQDRSKLKKDVDVVLLPHRNNGAAIKVASKQAKNVIKDLTAAYRQYNGAQNWNGISLSIANGISKIAKNDIFSQISVQCCHYFWWHGPHHLQRNEGHYWIHTGDSVLVGADGNAWRSYYQNILDDVSVFQVPHHGSKNNFDQNMLSSFSAKPPIPFVTCKSTDNKHPHPSVISLLNSHGVDLWSVDEHQDSELSTCTEIHFQV